MSSGGSTCLWVILPNFSPLFLSFPFLRLVSLEAQQNCNTNIVIQILGRLKIGQEYTVQVFEVLFTSGKMFRCNFRIQKKYTGIYSIYLFNFRTMHFFNFRNFFFFILYIVLYVQSHVSKNHEVFSETKISLRMVSQLKM